MAKTKLSKRYGRLKRNPEGDLKPNPPLLTDIFQFAAPGFAGYAATRFLTHVSAEQIEKRKPSWGKHAGAAASIASFLAAWLLIHRVKFLKDHHTPLVVGSAIAAVTSLLQLYFPALGWFVSDPLPPTLQPSKAQGIAAGELTGSSRPALRPIDEDPNDYTFNDSFDAGRYSKTGHVQADAPTSARPSAPSDMPPPDDLSDLEGQNMGIFEN